MKAQKRIKMECKGAPGAEKQRRLKISGRACMLEGGRGWIERMDCFSRT